MIGQLDFWEGTRRYSVSLDDALVWQCPDAAVAERLNAQFPGFLDADLPTVVLGRHLLYQAAERLSGTVRVRSVRAAALTA